jgi:hypothetical protein
MNTTRELRYHWLNWLVPAAAVLLIGVFAVEWMTARRVLNNMQRRNVAMAIESKFFDEIAVTGHLPEVPLTICGGIPVVRADELWLNAPTYEDLLKSIPTNPVILIVEWPGSPNEINASILSVNDSGVWIQNRHGTVISKVSSMSDFFVVRLRRGVEYVATPLKGDALKRFLNDETSVTK